MFGGLQEICCKFTFVCRSGRMRRRPHKQMLSVSPANAPKIDFLPFGGCLIVPRRETRLERP